eukprot:CAMPEP_0197073424 /NCGR_PEP_ID=MMETSP1384-20130603/210596_1 /TAXON_ID=29189 /ORGANISM="Ammonia sp." /LENGTH=871 /DNA_ID=CAMNT_0042512261 /DNA_START=58 /DNA_END=2674 /DNA_ORIENTATION=+
MLTRTLILLSLLYLCIAQDPEITTEEEGVEPITAKFTDEQRNEITTGGESKEFQAEVNRLMEIIVNSLYKTRDIFLRELISNANDAIDKVRMLSLTDKELLGDNTEFEIKVQADRESGTLTILDTGIGMSANDLVANLGTIAHSGTAAFLDEALNAAAESGTDGTNLIGQFGVGFYSAFLVADEVTVISKANGDDQHIWSSTADGNYRIIKDPRGNTLGRGTAIILKLKDDALSFLESDLIESTIKRYSQFIQYPIYLYSTKTETEEVALDEDEAGDGDDDLTIGEEEDAEAAPKTKTIEHVISYWKRLNENKPIWSRRPSEIEDEEYVNFYKALTSDSSDPLDHTHFKAEGEDGDDDLTIGEEEDAEAAPKTKTIEHVISYWKRLNENKPIWSRRPSEIEDEEYVNFYKALTSDSSDPLDHTHFKAEGEIEFDSILYIPSSAPPGMYDQYYNSKSAMKLYVRRVLVADQFEDIVPRYLNFVKGLVDSNDLPLNVNREDLQKSKVMKLISRKLTRKVLDMLKKMAMADEPDEEDEDEEAGGDGAGDDEEEKHVPSADSNYSKFWKEFGKSIKLGLLEDQRNKKRLLDLLRFPTSKTRDVPISLAAYVARMQPGQKHIYYISGPSIDEVEASPFMERLRARNWEVLYFVDNLDEYLNLQDYDDFQFQAINKDGTEIDGQKMQDFLKEKEDQFEDLKTWLKDVYGSRVSKVVISSALAESPMAIGTAKYGYSAYMEKLTKSQAFGAGAGIKATKILQINYRHPVIIDLKNRIEDGEGEDNEQLKDMANLLLDVALIKSGFEIENEHQQPLADTVDRIVRTALKVPLEAQLEAEPEFAHEVDLDEEDEEGDEDEDEEDEEELEDESDEENKEEL